MNECKPLGPGAAGGHRPGGRGLHLSTFRLNLSTFCGIRRVVSVLQRRIRLKLILKVDECKPLPGGGDGDPHGEVHVPREVPGGGMHSFTCRLNVSTFVGYDGSAGEFGENKRLTLSLKVDECKPLVPGVQDHPHGAGVQRGPRAGAQLPHDRAPLLQGKALQPHTWLQPGVDRAWFLTSNA